MADADSRQSGFEHSSRILVVEDDPDVRQELADILEEAGYSYDVAADGNQALLRLAQEPRPELILLDLVLPDLDGWQFRAAQLSAPDLAEIPVLAMSGTDSAQARAIHAEAFLAKPFGSTELLSAVERVLLRAKCRRLQVRVQDAERFMVLGTMAAEVGHEINNPLTYILLNLSEIQRRVGVLEDEQLSTLVKETTEGVQQIRELVATLASRSPRRDIRAAHVDLSVVLETAISMTAHHFAGRAQVVRDFPDAPAIRGNATRLGQLFINLLANAAQAIPPGGPETPRVTVHARKYAGLAIVEIRDSGVGMPAEVRARLFEPFFTTKAPGAGTGLGLVVSRKIAREHGGRIEIESAPGEGTTVRVLLPLDARPTGTSSPES